ncbi:MAG: MMPL family transporter [Nakamurella multipartita]
MGRRPWPWALGALTLLLVLAAPVLGMRTWPQDAGSQPESNTTRIAYDLVADEFGPGANGPFLLAVDLTGTAGSAGQTVVSQLTERVAADPGVAAVAPPVLNPAGDAALIIVQPTTGPQDEATVELLHRLRAELPQTVRVTGLTAVFADISDRLADRLWVVIAFVVGVSLLLLTAAFRSVIVAVKAAAMNLLSVAAAYGVMVAIFQWGWGAELLGLPHAVAISSWVPILMFTILFGLSMDYQVFLLSRIREDYLATDDPRGSVVRGLAGTGRVITCAAAIMVAVFVGFGLDADPVVKMMGVGMAVAVLIDATVVRMVLVPATMSILGRANWWLPRWLDRVLPHLDTEGSDPRPVGSADPTGGDPASTHPTPAGVA